MSKETKGLRTWIEVSRKAIARNYRVFRSRIGKRVKLMAVVKSNAYGHGLLPFAQEMDKLGADWLGVDSMVEALALRKAGVTTHILVLGFTLSEWLEEAAAHDISVAVSDFEHLKAVMRLRASKPLRVHIKTDTGMHRQGFQLKDMKRVLALITSQAFRRSSALEGLFTHFAAAKNPALPQYTLRQIDEFATWRTAFKHKKLSFISHASATSGTLLFPQAHFDMVRIGIGLYGLWPSAEARAHLKDSVHLVPVLSWKAVVSEVKRVPKGEKIGYDCTETLSRDSVIAIIPVGYWHGYSRKLSSIGRAIIRGKQCRVLGRVSMDMLIVDATGVSAKVGDEVALIGSQGRETVSAVDMAGLDDTSHYETVTRLNPLMRRIFK